MKRFSPREFLWLCAPVALIGAAIAVVKVVNPQRDADAVIVLDVTNTFDEKHRPNESQPILEMTSVGQRDGLRPVLTADGDAPTFSYSWTAIARGGPKDEIGIFYSQKLVARGEGHSRVIAQESNSNPPDYTDRGNQITLFPFGDDYSEITMSRTLRYEDLPLWTKQLEWHGDIVALPRDAGAIIKSQWVKPSAFPALARVRGAARVTKTFPIALDLKKIQAIQALELQPPLPSTIDRGADTSVTSQLRDDKRRVHARLIAVDGGQNRLLWSGYESADSPYLVPVPLPKRGLPARNSQFFKLRDVPPQWGEIVYLVDAAYDPNAVRKNTPGRNTAGNGNYCDAAEIERLKRAGWSVFSQRLTVRKKGETIKAATYPKTPNLQLSETKTSVSNGNWVIQARLKYSGPKPKPADYHISPDAPKFSTTDGQSVVFKPMNFGVETTSATPDEYKVNVIIPLKAASKPRPVIMKLEVADERAAPLQIEAKLTVPKTPA